MQKTSLLAGSPEDQVAIGVPAQAAVRSLIAAGPVSHAQAVVVGKDLGISRSLVFTNGPRFSCKKELQSTI
jgi:hypothetical protein